MVLQIIKQYMYSIENDYINDVNIYHNPIEKHIRDEKYEFAIECLKECYDYVERYLNDEQ